MAPNTGYVVTNHGDLESIFNRYSSGTKAGATGIKVGSQDLADRYQKSNNEGYDKISFDTNFRSKNPAAGAANGDLRYIFQYYGY